MISHYILSFMLLLSPNLIHCGSADVHSHNIDTTERESDEAHLSEDHDHYSDSGHNAELDHEAIIGSVREAEQYNKLSSEESKQQLLKLLLSKDLNADNYIDRSELENWILNSFVKLSKQEADEVMSEIDDNRDGNISWFEYMSDAFGVSPYEMGESGMRMQEEKAMFSAADLNGDGNLDRAEFEILATPRKHEIMHPFLLQQALRDRDQNKDGHIDFNDYLLWESGSDPDESRTIQEKEKFNHNFDLNKNGRLDLDEVKKWVIPDNDVIADEEVDHLFESADDDHDDRLSYDEVLEHHDVFVGSEATAYGDDLMGSHFKDELDILEDHDVFVGSEATAYGDDLMGSHFDDEL